MENCKMPKSLIIHPEHMIHDLGLKGLDLLIYAFIFSVYNLTEKSVNINKSYLAELFGYSRRMVINAVQQMVKCGVLVQYGQSFVPAFFMCKGHSVKKVHANVKKVHINDNFNDKDKKKESYLYRKYQEICEIARTPWLEDFDE